MSFARSLTEADGLTGEYSSGFGSTAASRAPCSGVSARAERAKKAHAAASAP